MKTLVQVIEKRILNLDTEVVKLKSKLEEDFLYNFEWGMQNEIYLNLKMKRHYTQLLAVIKEEQYTEEIVIEQIQSEVKQLTKHLLFGSQTKNSSLASANTAYTLDREVAAKFLLFLDEMLIEVREANIYLR